MAMELITDLIPLPVFIKQAAMSACYRLKANYQWVQNHCGHTMIRPQLKRNAPLARVRGGYITPRYVFDKNYIVNIPGKDDCKTRSFMFQKILSILRMARGYKVSARPEPVSTTGLLVWTKSCPLANIAWCFRQRYMQFSPVLTPYSLSRMHLPLLVLIRLSM